ncbi:IucA/IucC family protein [Staphylococcus simulans]|uniref:IucA/IucC family protein n=1 Tax=Staphylococcus simulans TaxID=1286 RepID=UPI000D03F4B3|nr:IucA/IucC family protein [Staphylococcus simulans]
MKNNLQDTHQQPINLTQEEQSAYDFLSANHPLWAEQFTKVLLTARDLITKRLVVSIYRENMVNQAHTSQILNAEEVPFALVSPTQKVMKMDWPASDQSLYAPISGFHAFDRIDMQGPFYFVSLSDSDHVQRIMHPEEVLNVILKEAPQYTGPASQQFSDDMMNSAANMALALSYQATALKDDTHSMLEIIEQASDSYLRSEQAVIEGHPLHPGAKLRKGLTPEMNIRYSSEFQHKQALKWIAVHNDLVRTQTLEHTYNDTLFNAFDGLKTAFEQAVPNDAKEAYSIIILHPWQYDEILHRDYQDEINQGLILDIDYDTTYYAGLSFRTLIPKLPQTTPHVKLSTNVHITGEIRTLSEQTTFNGPLVTHIVNRILAQDALFKDIQASTIPETAGIHFYNANDQGEYQTERSEQLGSLLRENVYHLTEDNTINIIPSSFVSVNPNEGTAVVNALITRFKAAQKFDAFESAALSWLSDYAQALVDLVVPLMVKYGIALEAHLQNAVASFNLDGSFNHIFIRDFEGLRIDESQLNQLGYPTAHFHEKSRILTDKSVSVFNKAFYSTIQNHLGEMILTIAQHAEDSAAFENNLWNEVKRITQAKFQQMHEDKEIDNERLSRIEQVFFDQTIDYKCVTTMRLEDEAHEYTYVKVDNPLASH